MAVETVYYANDNLITVSGLTAVATSAFVTTAVVTVTVVDSAGNAVSGGSWPVSLTYVAGTNASYNGTLGYALDLRPGRSYIAQVTASAGTNLHGYWETRLIVAHRRTT